MSERGDQGGFEERLLVRLQAVVAERGAAAAGAAAPAAGSPGPWRRRALRLALAGAAAIVIAVAVLVVGSGDSATSRAYAVEPLAGGGVAIKIYSLEDAAGLEAALAQEGITAHVDWLEAQTTCRERKLKPATVRSSMGGRLGGFEVGGPLPALTIGVMTTAQYRHLARAFRRGDLGGDQAREAIPNISLDPRSFRPGQSVVISGSPEPHGGDPEGGYRASVEVVEGPVPACEPVPEAAGSIGAIKVSAGAAGASAAARAAVPATGQYLFTKTEVVQLESWDPNGPGTGPKDHPRHFTSRVSVPGGHRALVPTTKEVWTAADGRTHVRETLGRIEFLSPAAQRLWEAAGSPPPFEFDPAEHRVREDGAGNPTKVYSAQNWRGKHAFAIVPKLFRLPTEPEALRTAIEGTPAGSPPQSTRSRNGDTTAQRLLEILAEPQTSPALAKAAFEALAEIPGIGHEPHATDAAGRQGEALTWEDQTGFGRRVIFDPASSKVLAEAEMVFGAPSVGNYGVPAGTVFRETALLDAAIVDSVPGAGRPDAESAGSRPR